MGHFYDVTFDAHLTEEGFRVLTFARASSWEEAAAEFQDLPFVSRFAKSGAERVTRSPHSSLGDLEGSILYPSTRQWVVSTMFKNEDGFSREELYLFLRNVIIEPVQVEVTHDTWDDPAILVVAPRGHGSPLEQARQAKEQFRQRTGRTPWLRGVGITSLPGGCAVQVNVGAKVPAVLERIPEAINGVEIIVVEVGENELQ